MRALKDFKPLPNVSAFFSNCVGQAICRVHFKENENDPRNGTRQCSIKSITQGRRIHQLFFVRQNNVDICKIQMTRNSYD